MKTIILKEEAYKGLTIQRIEEDGKKRWKIKEYENFYFSTKKNIRLWIERYRQARLFDI